LTESQDTRAPAAQSAITAYNDLLLRMERITSDLTDAIGDSRMSDVEKLLNDRAVLCDKLGASLRGIREIRENPGAGNSAAVEHARQLESRVLAKQALCEAALQRELGECRSALATLKQRKGLKAAYTPTSESNPACFLDNRR
jgi:hypothetical protein